MSSPNSIIVDYPEPDPDDLDESDDEEMPDVPEPVAALAAVPAPLEEPLPQAEDAMLPEVDLAVEAIPPAVVPEVPVDVKPRSLPEGVLGTIFQNLDFASAKNASLCTRAFAKASRGRLFQTINLGSPGPPNLQVAGATLPDKLSRYMMSLDMATLEHLQKAVIKVDYGSSDVLLKSCFKWWTSILNLTTDLRSFDLEVVLPAIALAANTAAEEAYKAKDEVLKSLMSYLVRMPSSPTLHTLTISMQDRAGSRLDWIHVLSVLASSDYFGSIHTLKLPYLRSPTTEDMASVLKGIDTFSPRNLFIMRARYLPSVFPDVTCNITQLEYYVFGEDADGDSPMLDELTLLLSLFPAITNLKITEATNANLSLASLPVSMPFLETLTYEGRYASAFLANLTAPSLTKIAARVPNLHPEFFSPILTNGTLPSLRHIVFCGSYDSMNENWLADWSCLSELAEFVGVQIKLKVYFTEKNPWEGGSPMMMSILHWTSKDLVKVITSNLWPCSNPDRPDLIHFSKLVYGQFRIDGGCEASTPSLHWLLVWMAGVTAPKLKTLVLKVKDAPGTDILLELAVVLANKTNFPALRSVIFKMELQHSAAHWDEETGGTGYKDYLKWVEKRVKQLVGYDIGASVVFGPMAVEDNE